MSLREGFEAWYAATYPVPKGPAGTSPAARKKAFCVKEALFVAWQASRESLVIELPGGSSTPDGQGISLDGFRVIDAMKAAGVKCEVKS